jgi:hypothetical protein
MRDWLTASGCTLVAMESTGIYWHQGVCHQVPRALPPLVR